MNPKRLGFQVVDINFGTFTFPLRVIVGPAEHVEKVVRFHLDDPDYIVNTNRKRGMFFHRTNWRPIIWLPRKPKTPAEYGTLAHELMHAITVMLVTWVGMTLNEDTDEAFAHAMSYAMGEILTALK